MTYLPEKGYKRILVLTAYFAIGGIAVWLFFKYLFGPLLPFLLAWVIAMLIRPMIDRICKHTKMPRKIVAFASVLFVFTVIFGLITLLFGRIINELRALGQDIMTDASSSIESAFAYIQNITEKVPFLAKIENRDVADKIKDSLIDMVQNTVTTFSAKIPTAVIDFVSSLPSVLLFAVALITATFYLGSSVGKINAFIAGLLPKDSREHLFNTKKKLLNTCMKFLRAYIVLLLITFFQLLIGFLILGIPYSLTLSAIIALIDILPVLGVGTVLIPWSLILLIEGNVYLGIGILILFAIIWISRQIIEPKIVGQSVGLSPLATLISMYVGFRFIGVIGLFVLPIAVIAVKNIYDAVKE